MPDNEEQGRTLAVTDDGGAAAPGAGPSLTLPAGAGANGSASDDVATLRPGQAIGRFEVVRVLGQGGMGIVYLAYDPTLDRPVALKLLRRQVRSAQARLLREGQAVAKLAHPEVVRVYDVGTHGDDLFIAMEYVDGTTLGRWLAAERRTTRAILEQFAAAGRGLAAAHDAGLVHRDFKPDNVLVGRDGRVVVTDFGLARIEADEAPAAPRTADAPAPAPAWLGVTLTRTGSVLGTPAYMSPEQMRGELADARSDQFSFCVALWEALFGRRPFELPGHGAVPELLAAVERGIVAPVDPPPGLVAVERALRRGLSLAPADRFPELRALLDALAPARALEPQAERVTVGERLGHFRIDARIGQGGMGIVYRAFDELLGRDVALKVLPPDVVARADRRDRFLREARAAAAVVHPAIATVFEVGADGDVPFIAMEYVTGRTLRQVLASGPLAVAEVLRIGIQVADALSRAHRAGVVHRDLKPENVMLDRDGGPKILDFGLARLIEPDAGHDRRGDRAVATVVTEEGTIVGTPAYMSPEQARGLPLDHRSDLFSFGTVAFELLVGTLPFRGASTLDIATAIIRDAPPPLAPLVPGLPLELERIVLKCLEKEADDRYQSATELVVDLRRLLRQTESGMAPAATLPTLPAPSRRRRVLPWLLGGAALAVAAAAVVTWPRGAPARPAVVTAPPRAAAARKISSTNGNVDASLSPDGRSIAMLRDGRLTLQGIDDGRTRDLTPSGGRVSWIDWFPDGKRLLLGMATPTLHAELRALDVVDGRTTTLGPRVWGARASHAGTRLATFDEGGIRVSDLDGSHDRLLVGTREEAEFSWPSWSPDDRWIAYAVRGPGIVPAIRVVATDGSADVLVVEDAALASPRSLPDYTWMADGRILYRTSDSLGSTLLTIDIDLATGKARGAARRLASVPDLVILNGTSDDGHLLYGRLTHARSTLRADLAAARLEPSPVTRSDWRLLGRSPDRATTYYQADASLDHTELLAVDASDRARIITSFPGRPITPQLTSDGAAIMYLYIDPASGRITLRRVPVAGGEAQLIEELPYAAATPPEFTEDLVVQLACATRAPRCVLGATEADAQVWYEIDPVRGRGDRLATLPGPAPWRWSLSPDGTHVLVAGQRERGVIQILDLATRQAREAVHLADRIVEEVAWVDGRSFLAISARYGVEDLLRVDPTGHVTATWSTSTAAIGHLRVFDEPRSALYFETSTPVSDYWLLPVPAAAISPGP